MIIKFRHYPHGWELGGGNVPLVMYAIENDITPKIDGNGKAFSLRAREYKDVQIVVMEMKK